ncbi:SRPBCC family protein [Psychromonas sp. Urea-02u-13]|uniref:SRPBCC family protein n=1 Tax=Psychromonas sp. Urea-02u-13 TaxID=2058326 RepID=UPI000C342A98|nr:SRPBCC family protein [Psychromonas sp. Urea-02u-13]PKG38880.1 SRPBCC family protein [Psychromonas sp. Urea-02u-13]
MFSTNQVKIIHASVDHVWNRIHDFHRLDWAPTVINHVEKIGNLAGNAPGARRRLNGSLYENLLAIDEVKHQVKYSIDDGEFPIIKRDISNYVGTIKLNETKEGITEMVWSSSWDSKNKNAVEYYQDIHATLMGELDKSFHFLANKEPKIASVISMNSHVDQINN